MNARWLVTLLVVGLIGVCLCGGTIAPLQAIFLLAFGWVRFIARVGLEIEWSVESAALGVTCLVLFTIGLHGFLRWLSSARQIQATREVVPLVGVPTHTIWKARWSIQIVLLTLVLFVAGISMVGITHQLLWMARSKEPVFSFSGDAMYRMQSRNNLSQLSIAASRFHNESTTLPPGYLSDTCGLPLHGWMTLLLPQLDQQQLHDSIDRSKSWDDAANRLAFQTALPFATQSVREHLPQKGERGYALAHYSGSVDLLGTSRKWKYQEITDGASQTILLGEAAGNYRPWGHPRNVRNVRLGINQTPDGFGGPWHSGGAQFAFADGSVRYVSSSIDPRVLEALATPNARDQVGSEFADDGDTAEHVRLARQR